ncbi:hypothetical protein FF2_031992 [Malus domestica]
MPFYHFTSQYRWLDHRFLPSQAASEADHLAEGKRDCHKHFGDCSHSLGFLLCSPLSLGTSRLHTCKEPV